jgi:hypothetical protein
MTVLTAVNIMTLVLWDMAQQNLVGGYEYFRATYCLHLQNLGLRYTKRLAIIYRTACDHNSEDSSFKLCACYTSEKLGATQLILYVVDMCTKSNI